jgi:drug/metabolite transporter (DMT)-like permease
MLWPILAILTALCESLKDLFGKKSLRTADEYLVAWTLGALAVPVLVPVLFITGLPAIGPEFWWALLVSGGINALASILYIKAIKQSDLSVTVPLVTVTPLFLLATSPLIVGEFPNLGGVAGIVLIVLGSYMLNIRERHRGYLAPFRALLSQPGPKLMLVVAFIWSISGTVDKIGVLNSSPIFWAFAVRLFIAITLLPVMLRRPRPTTPMLPADRWQLLAVGFFAALTVIFQNTAITLTLVAYVIAIKRTSAVMSVLFGHFILGEKNLRERLLGATIMVLGVVVITVLA